MVNSLILLGVQGQILGLIISCIAAVVLMVAIIAFRINYRLQMKVGFLMDKETSVYNGEGVDKYIQVKKSKLTSPTFVAVDIVNLDHLYYNAPCAKKKMMIEISNCMLRGMLPQETLARVSFEKFMLVLDGKNREQVKEVCNKITERLQALEFDYYGAYNFQIKYGIYDKPELDKPTISRNRTMAIIDYSPINDGNIYYYVESVDAELMKLDCLNQMKQTALDCKQFVPYIQPIVNFRTGKVVGGEVIVRWIDSKGSEVYLPEVFIPQFESNGFIKKIDLEMFERTCLLMQSLRNRGFKDIFLTTNISKASLETQSIANDLTNIIVKYPQIKPSDIQFEISEMSIMSNSQVSLSSISLIRGLGYKIAMDNFGKEYSSLGFLSNNHFDTIKIDKMFFENGLVTDKDTGLVQNILTLLENVNATIICQGIAAQVTIDKLATLTRDTLLQGDALSKAIPDNQFESFLQTTFKFDYPEIKKEEKVKVVEKVVEVEKKVEEKQESKTETPKVELKVEQPNVNNAEIDLLKKQLDDLRRDVAHDREQQIEEARKKEFEALRAEIAALKNTDKKNEETSQEVEALKLQLEELKKNQELGEAEKREVEKIEQEVNEYDEYDDSSAEKEEANFENLLDELDSEEEHSNELEEIDLDSIKLDDKDDDVEEDDEDDENDSSDDDKPTLSKEEVEAMIKGYQEKYKEDWIAKAKEELKAEGYQKMVDDVKYYAAAQITKKNFAERMKHATKEQQDLYNIVKNEFMKYDGVTSEQTNKYDKIMYKRKCIAQVNISKKRVRVFFALDPNMYSSSQFPHKDVSKVKAHAQNPMYFAVKSNLSVTRFKKLVADAVKNAGANGKEKEDYKPVNYAFTFRFYKKK